MTKTDLIAAEMHAGKPARALKEMTVAGDCDGQVREKNPDQTVLVAWPKLSLRCRFRANRDSN